MIASSMASSSSTSTSSRLWSSSSTPLRKERTTLCAPLSACVIFHAKSQSFYSFRWNPQPGLSFFSSWNGLKRHLGVPIPKQYANMERKKGKCRRREGVYASLFGVGAPEALVIGVVALLVFGPKGLAEVARNLGKTLRAFQPTIRELQDVSREFKSTLEREIGLDDFQNPTQQQQRKTIYTSSSNPNSSVDPNGVQAYSSEEYLKITEEQLKASSSAAQQQQQQTDNAPTLEVEPNLSDPPTKAQIDPTQQAAVMTPPPTQEPQA